MERIARALGTRVSRLWAEADDLLTSTDHAVPAVAVKPPHGTRAAVRDIRSLQYVVEALFSLIAAEQPDAVEEMVGELRTHTPAEYLAAGGLLNELFEAFEQERGRRKAAAHKAR